MLHVTYIGHNDIKICTKNMSTTLFIRGKVTNKLIPLLTHTEMKTIQNNIKICLFGPGLIWHLVNKYKMYKMINQINVTPISNKYRFI